MPKLCNLARMTTATTGTGTITLGVAVSGYLTFAGAGVADGTVVFYGIKDGAASECGYGTYTATGTTLTRNVVKSTNSNAAISLDGSAEVYVTAVASDGGDLLPGFSNPLRGFDGAINLQLNASVATNLLTVAVKGNNGSDPSNSNPVLVPFRDATAANGDPVWVAITSALSINTNAAGATLGSANGTPFRLWVVAFNNAGTAVLALWQSVTGGASPTAIAPLNEAVPANTTAISGTATSAGTFYTPSGTALTGKPFRILGYLDFASGLTTAGSYASGPTTIQLFGPGIKRPGEPVQSVLLAESTSESTASSTYVVSANLKVSISPSAAPNLVEVTTSCTIGQSGSADTAWTRLSRGTANNTNLIGSELVCANTGAGIFASASHYALDAPGTTSSTTYALQFRGNSGSATAQINPQSTPSLIKAAEIQV